MTFNKRFCYFDAWLPLILFFSQSWFLFQKHDEKYRDRVVKPDRSLCWTVSSGGWQVQFPINGLPCLSSTSSLTLTWINLVYPDPEPRRLFNRLSSPVSDSKALGLGCTRVRSTSSLPNTLVHLFVFHRTIASSGLNLDTCCFLAFSSFCWGIK